MKRFLTLLVCFALLLTVFTACDNDQDGDDIAEVIAPDDLAVTRKIGEFAQACFADKDSNMTLRLKLPKEWTYTKAEGGYTVMQEGEAIGSVYTGQSAVENMNSAKTLTYHEVGIEILTGFLTKGDVTEPYYRMLFSFSEGSRTRVTTLEVKQSVMDAVIVKWCSQPELLMIKGYHDIPEVPMNEGNGQDEVLMIGNSFLYSRYSNLQAILQDLINAGEKEINVVRGAYGYASVETYATSEEGDYPAIRADIAAGRFSIVFLCGLYSSADVTHIQTMIDLCADSGTRLVLLPAHNEASAQITYAQTQYPNVYCLNWKAEIDTLIDCGVLRDHFVNEDQHGHSKPLAGYVGAHMIYRSLFGELPPALPDDCESVSKADVAAILGDYVSEGVQRVAESEIKRFS